jgi:hypothetical protein
MNNRVKGQGTDPVTELAALLQRVAAGAGGKHGRQNWDSLVQVFSGYHLPGPGGQGVGEPELTTAPGTRR